MLFGGAIVDRAPRRTLLYFTQTAAMILAFALGILTLMGSITVWEIIVLAFLLGVVNGIDTPARSALIPDLVEDRALLPSAISLNTGMVTAAQAVGPALGGILIVFIGVGGTFIVNGLTFVAVLIALYAMHLAPHIRKEQHPPLVMVKKGFQYVWSVEGLPFLMFLSFFLALAGRSYSAIFPVIATDFYHGDSTTLGWLLSAFGIGAALGGILLSKYVHRIPMKRLILEGNALTGLALLAFPLIGTLPWGAACILVAGLGFSVSVTSLVTILQHVSDGDMRGRVLSIFYFIFFGGYTIGNFGAGWLAEHWGSGPVMTACGILIMAISCAFYPVRGKILEIYE